MAVNHNFKEGIDWVADPTGETPLANHIFISKSGNDSTGTGTPQNPFLTVQGASDNAVGNFTYIIGTGLYNESNITGFNTLDRLKGDGYVLFQGTGSELLIAGRTQIENLFIKNYGNIMSGWGITFTNCVFIDSNLSMSGATGTTELIECISVNCTLDFNFSGTVKFVKCLLFNTNATHLASGQAIQFISSFIDENSIVNTNGIGLIDFCLLNGVATIEFDITNTIQNENPQFNNLAGFDFSVNAASPLIGAGEDGVNIGNVFLGSSYFQGVSLLDEAIDANSNLAYNSLGEIEMQQGSANAEIFETFEEEALELSVLGAINISGFLNFTSNTPDSDNALLNPNNLILEINVALLDGVFIGWKKYRWNQQPTDNLDGTPNGDSDYNWADNNKVRWKKRKFRVTIRSNYNQA